VAGLTRNIRRLPGSNRQLQTGDLPVFTPLSMPSPRKALFVLLLSFLTLVGLTGCGPSKQDSSIPWSRPADWEGRIPGMGR
jgi:hypothetical protein